jgi:hypothetical protein
MERANEVTTITEHSEKTQKFFNGSLPRILEMAPLKQINEKVLDFKRFKQEF